MQTKILENTYAGSAVGLTVTGGDYGVSAVDVWLHFDLMLFGVDENS